MTFSSFDAYPGLVIWHSTDLVAWTPLGPALRTQVGTVWAVDLCKHGGRYFIYLPALAKDQTWKIHAIWADDIRAMVGLQFAVRHPERVEKLIAVNRVAKVVKTGELTKAVKLNGIGATAGAKAAIEAAGGSVA